MSYKQIRVVLSLVFLLRPNLEVTLQSLGMGNYSGPDPIAGWCVSERGEERGG